MVVNKFFNYVKDGIQHKCYIQSGRYDNGHRLHLELISIDTHKSVASLTREVSSYRHLPEIYEIVAEPSMVNWLIAHGIAELDPAQRAVQPNGSAYGRLPVMIVTETYRRRFLLA